ncbi:YdbH domain-containing protein [Fodinicurvata sediminis]|uniref:YdbH domain-containing protein n=1 Tax=Fodinicurvata sediminis TaxID=1121832 RepID=UPI0003B64125|nr:YdbH domain-containing protein [Fodinicurvata sediminis]
MSRRKKGLFTVLALLGVILIASAGTVALRKPVLQWAADHYLQQAGIPAKLTVAEVGLKQAVIEDLHIRNEMLERISADQLIIRYNPGDLLSGVLPELELHGLDVLQEHTDRQNNGSSASLDGEGAPQEDSIPSPQDLVGNWEVSDIQLQNAEYTLVHEGKRYSLSMDALLRRTSSGKHDLQLTFHEIDDSESRVTGTIALNLTDLLPVAMEGNLEVAVPKMGIEGEMSFSGREISDSPDLNLNGTVQITKGEWEDWVDDLPIQDEQMQGILSLNGNLRLPEATVLAGASEGIEDWVKAIYAKGKIGLEVSKLSTPIDRRFMDASMSADFLLEGAKYALFPKDPARLSLTSKKHKPGLRPDGAKSGTEELLADSYSLHLSEAPGDRAFIEVSGLDGTPRIEFSTNAELEGTQGEQLSGRLSGHILPKEKQLKARVENLLVESLPLKQLGTHRISGSASLSGTFESYNGHATLSAVSEGFSTPYASTGRSTAELSIEFSGETSRKLEVAVLEPGTVNAKGLSLPAGLEIPESEIRIDQLTALFLRNEGDSDFNLGINGAAELKEQRFRQFRANGAPLTGQLQPLSVDFEMTHDTSLPSGQSPAFSATGNLEETTLDEPALSLSGLDFEAQYPLPQQDTPLLQVNKGLMSSTADPPLFTPLELTGQVFLRSESLVYSLAGENPYSKANIIAEGSHSLETGNGGLNLSLPSHRFLIDGLQPSGLFPVLDMLDEVEGDAALNLNISWNDYGLNGRGQLYLNGLDFDVFDTSIKNLDSALGVGSLLPLRTAEPQAFRIETASIGNILLSEISGRLELAKGETNLPVVIIENLHAAFAEGDLRIDSSEFDLSNNRHNLVLRLEDISIAQLVDLIDIEDLDADGRFTGEIPVTINGGTFEIADGHLESSQNGQISFKSEKVRSALASGGQAVSLMMDALENFHYDRLRLDIHKPAEGESRLAIKLEGQNPDVLDGHPFDLNINLSGNLAPLLQAISEGRRLSRNILDDMLELVQ